MVAAGGGLLVGLVVFVIVGKVRRRLTDPLLDSALSFITPFAAYVAAEEIHASGVIAVVVAGLLLGHKAPILQTAQSRIQEHMNWDTIAFLLESGVFLLIGLQASSIITGVGSEDVTTLRVVVVCAAVLLGVIVIRLVWVFAARYLLIRPGPDPATRRRPPWTYTFLIGWAGMRGVVTLAAAFVIPSGAPHRELLLLVAFTVTAGTLFLQGLSLPWLARWLRVPSPDPLADALARANLLQEASQAGFAALEEIDDEDLYGVRAQIEDRLERRNFAAWESLGASEEETPSEAYARLRREMIDAERAHVLEVRSTGAVAHDVVRQVLAMLDIEESMLEYSDRERAAVRAAVPVSLEGDCEHLRAVQKPVEPNTPGECATCLAEGTGLGAPAHVRRLRQHRLLRLLAGSPRERAPPRDRASRDALGRAR